MPAKSKAQQKFAAMSKSPAGRKAIRARGGKPMPASAAEKFAKAPRGSTKSLPAHKGKGKR